MSDKSDRTYATGQLRDRLANERTLLAWIRTAIALMGFGLVVAKFSVFLDMVGAQAGLEATHHPTARITGVALVLVGVLVALAGSQRTVAYARILDPDGRPPGNGVLVATSALVILFGVGLAIYLALA
jgi:putative membrane protein